MPGDIFTRKSNPPIHQPQKNL